MSATRCCLAALTLVWAGAPWLPAQADDLCRNGKAQSPVAITVESLEPTQGWPLRWELRPSPLRLRHDGHTLRVRVGPGNFLSLGAERYQLTEVHFHTPGGDTLLGESFPMAAHLLLRDARQRLLAVVLPMRLGSPNPFLTDLLPAVPAQAGPDHDVPGRTVDMGHLVPSAGRYYRYTGSLTAAPCTEGVAWLVLGTPASVSEGQLAQWARHFADNIRAAQPLRGRRVQAIGE